MIPFGKRLLTSVTYALALGGIGWLAGSILATIITTISNIPEIFLLVAASIAMALGFSEDMKEQK